MKSVFVFASIKPEFPQSDKQKYPFPLLTECFLVFVCWKKTYYRHLFICSFISVHSFRTRRAGVNTSLHCLRDSLDRYPVKITQIDRHSHLSIWASYSDWSKLWQTNKGSAVKGSKSITTTTSIGTSNNNHHHNRIELCFHWLSCGFWSLISGHLWSCTVYFSVLANHLGYKEHWRQGTSDLSPVFSSVLWIVVKQ